MQIRKDLPIANDLKNELLHSRRDKIIGAGFVHASAFNCSAYTGLVGLTLQNPIVECAGFVLATYLLCEEVCTAFSFGERNFHLTQTLLEKIGITTNQTATEIETSIAGRAESYIPLKKGVAKVGDIYYADPRMTGVMEQGRVISVQEDSFTSEFNWGGIITHIYGVNEGGILRKKPFFGREKFYTEIGQRESLAAFLS